MRKLCIILFCIFLSAGCVEIDGAKKKALVNSTISYEIKGEGPPLLMLIGTSARMNQWPPSLIEELGKENQLILIDYPGIGESTPYNKEFTFSTISEDLAALLKELNINKTNLLGWSLGGWIAQQFTLENPQMVNKLILVATDPGSEHRAPDLDNVIELFDNMAVAETQEEQNQLRTQLLDIMFPNDVDQNFKDEVHQLYKDGGDVFPSVTIRQLDISGVWIEPGGGVYDQLDQITQSVLIFHGTEDIVVPTINSQIFVDKLPNAELQLIDNGGHGLLYQYPVKIGQKINQFLTEDETE